MRVAATLGGEVRRSRLQRDLTLAELGDAVGIGPTRLHEIEVGQGASAPLALWFALGSALGRPFAAGLSREIPGVGGPADAGHLAAQEVVLALAQHHRRSGSFELPTRTSNRAGGFVDVGIRDDAHRAFILIEVWNRLDDLGEATRTGRRKVAEAADLAAVRGYRVASCWLLVDTMANRAIVRRYPAVLRSLFSGSSVAWVRCLAEGAPPPAKPGIAWIDARSGRISALRLPPVG